MAERFQHLDGLRGVAAAVVVINHAINAFDFALRTGSPAHSLTNWDIWLSGAPCLIPLAANLAVCLFFAMSGFVLVGAFDAAPIGFLPLLAKRYTRLAIPVTCICLLSCALLAAGWMANKAVAAVTRSSWLDEQFRQTASLADALREGAWTSFFPVNNLPDSYNTALWTMPIEFAGSVGMLLACCATKRLTRAAGHRKRACLVIFSLLYLAFFESYLGLFAAGALMRITIPTGCRQLTAKPALPVALIAIGLFLGTIPVSQAAWPIFSAFPNIRIPDWMPWPAQGPFLWHTIGAVLMLGGLQSSALAKRALQSPPCQWFGKISFSLYLIHIPILMTLGCQAFLIARNLGASQAASAVAAVAVFFPAALLCAQAFTLAIDQPAIRLSGQLARRIQTSIDPAVRSSASIRR